MRPCILIHTVLLTSTLLGGFAASSLAAQGNTPGLQYPAPRSMTNINRFQVQNDLPGLRIRLSAPRAWRLESSVRPGGPALNKPEEYGPHWDGFGKRYGMRLTGVATGNAIEAGLGRAWGEDPRYFRSAESRPLLRLRHAAALVFVARRADGRTAPAFARYTGVVGNNFISNTWRVPSESTASAALTRSALGFAGRFVSNVFDEFWQDMRTKVGKRR